MRPETPGEIRLDHAVHIIGLGAAAVAVVVLLRTAMTTGDGMTVGAVAVYALSLLAMLGISAAYHLSSHPIRKAMFRKYDHAAIFILIAGTYTPFGLLGLGGLAGLGLVVLTWLIAIGGVSLKLLRPGRHEKGSLALYLALGWIGLPVVPALLDRMPLAVMLWLFAGGILYTLGVAFHVWESLKYQNAIWHAFVLVAAGCHYLAVLRMVSL